MYAQIPALIGQAIQHFQHGQLPQAQALLTQVLTAQPRSFDALHILGVIQAMQGRRTEAIELFRKALTINKNHSFLQFNMAKALSENGQDEEALVHHKRATQLAPEHAEAWLNYGRSLLNLGRNEEAVTAFERATTAQPAFAAAWSNLGFTLNKLEKRPEALVALDRAIELQPDFAEAYNNKGQVLDQLDDPQGSLDCFERALLINPNYTDAWQNKGVKLGQMERHIEAIDCFKRALELNPALEKAWNYMAASYLALNKVHDAIACYEKAITIRPDYATAQANLGVLLLQTGEFSRGWEKFEYRWQAEEGAPEALQTNRPLWNGAPSDRPLLLWGEQGIGDQILYGSILPDLAALPRKKYVALDKRLIPLFARSMEGFDFVEPAQVNDTMDFAEHLPLGSLPRLFRPALESFAQARHPFLRADPQRAEALRKKMERGGRLICGVSWSSARKVIGKHKSISLEQMLLPLAASGLHFVDLQYGDTADERKSLKMRHGIEVQKVEEIDNFNDIDGLAALIQACDLVISTSNSTAHLAGALGKETLLLLPSGKKKIWYWTEFEGHNPWYPSIRSFAQTTPGEWLQPIEQLCQYLLKA